MSAEVPSTPRAWQSFLTSLGYDWSALNLQHIYETWPLPPRVSKHYARQIDWTNPQDPMLQQVVPSQQERHVAEYERQDPIGDHEHMVTPGAIHRYKDRLLVWPHLACGIHCRFCFRREDVGGSSEINWELVTNYLRQHSEIQEVILSGGDPGMLSIPSLERIIDRLLPLEHIQKFRLHSRVLVTDPERISDQFLSTLTAFTQSQSGRQVIWMHHVNHAQELTPESRDRTQAITALGFQQRSQTVLLRGINADVASQRALHAGLYAHGIESHYLHHLDLAQGTSHFRLSIAEGLDLYAQMQANLPPNQVPKYILDLPGGHGKVQVPRLWRKSPGMYEIPSPVTGKLVTYLDPAHTANVR